MALIKCENVSVGYEGQTVVKDLDFQIDAGDYLCIVGENGSGKSTLVKSLLGLKSVEKGQILFGDGLRQNEIGYLPQQTDVQKDFPASVYEVVLSGRLNSRGIRPFYTAADRKTAYEKNENAGHRRSVQAVLQGSLRGPEAESASGESALRHEDAAASGRAGDRTGSDRYGGILRIDTENQSRGGHCSRDGFP